MSPYFNDWGFNVDLPFKETSEWISKTFVKKNKEVKFSVSLHHLDYADGIEIYLKSEFGNKYLRAEVQNYSKKEVPVYLYFVEKIDSEFDRILIDFKTYLEKYII